MQRAQQAPQEPHKRSVRVQQGDSARAEAKNEAGVTREEDRTSVSVYFTLSILVCIEFPLVENKGFYLTLSMTGPH